jgi:FtsZ-interacting cell division protein ZipA
MSDYPSYKARPVSTISFIIGAILIVALLLFSVYFGRKYVLSAQKPSSSTKISKKSDEKQDKEKEESSKKDSEAQEKKAADEKKKADEAVAKAAAEEKKKQEKAAAAAEQQTQANAADPSHVASTGPEDTLLTVLGVFALSYAGYRFYDSRKKCAS